MRLKKVLLHKAIGNGRLVKNASISMYHLSELKGASEYFQINYHAILLKHWKDCIVFHDDFRVLSVQNSPLPKEVRRKCQTDTLAQVSIAHKTAKLG